MTDGQERVRVTSIPPPSSEPPRPPHASRYFSVPISGPFDGIAFVCTPCGALVHPSSAAAHTAWHDRLDELYVDMVTRRADDMERLERDGG
jgi:hypothetical protein